MGILNALYGKIIIFIAQHQILLLVFIMTTYGHAGLIYSIDSKSALQELNELRGFVALRGTEI